jgi:hypothetical protein
MTQPTKQPRRKATRPGIKETPGLIVGRGDNQTVINPEEVTKLAKLGCTIEEMSDWFGVPANTIKYNFSDYIAKGRAETKQALRRAQIALALKGNATMLIWLGKNMLGQNETPNPNDTLPEMSPEEIDSRINELINKAQNEKSQPTRKNRTNKPDPTSAT